MEIHSQNSCRLSSSSIRAVLLCACIKRILNYQIYTIPNLLKSALVQQLLFLFQDLTLSQRNSSQRAGN